MPTWAEIERSFRDVDYPGQGRYVWRPGTGDLMWSDGLVEIYGRTSQPESEAEFLACLHPDDRTRVEGETAAFLTGGADSYSHSFRIVRPSGETRYVLDRARIERDEQGRVAAVHGSNVDITEFPHLSHTSMDQQSEASQPHTAPLSRRFGDKDRLEVGQRTSGIALAEIDYRNDSITLDAAAARLYGFGDAPATVSREELHAVIHPQDRDAVESQSLHATDPLTGGTMASVHRIVLSDGTVRWLQIRKRIDFVTIDGRRVPDRAILAALDITDRKRVENGLRASEERLSMAQKIAEIGVWDVDLVADETYWTEGLYELLEIDPERPPAPELFFENVHPDDVESVRDTFQKAIEDRSSFKSEFRMIGTDGTVRYLIGQGSVTEETNGRATRILGVTYDITARRCAANKLAEREAQLALFIEHAPAAIAMFDSEKRYIATSRRYITDLGLPDDLDLRGLRFGEYCKDTPMHWHGIQDRVLKGEIVSVEEEAFPRTDGRIDWLRWSMVPWYAEPEKVGGIIMFAEVITGQVEARQAIKQSEARYRALFGSINSGFCVVEVRLDAPDGRIDYRVIEANPAFYDQSGLPPSVLGGWVRDIAPDLEEHWYDIYGQVARTGEPQRFEDFSELLNGWFDVYAFRIDDPKDRHVAVLFHDITERKTHEDRVNTLLHEVNHRAKNVLSLVDVIARRTAAAGTDGFIDRFSERIKALATNQDILVSSNWEEIPLDSLVRSQLAHFEDILDHRILIDGPSVALTSGAAEKLGMALNELATNAGKYGALSNEWGEVHISWRTDGNPGAEFSMAWEEIGGPATAQPQKTGFGSLVSGELLEAALYGQVEARYPETGLQWQLTCPIASVTAKGTPPATAAVSTPQSGQGSTVLVVEDDMMTALSLAETLGDAGLTVIGPTPTADRALTLIGQTRPDFAVLDVNLGKETSERVGQELKRIGVPFLCVSGSSVEQVPTILRNAPFLSKPVDEQAMIEMIEHHAAEAG